MRADQRVRDGDVPFANLNGKMPREYSKKSPSPWRLERVESCYPEFALGIDASAAVSLSSFGFQPTQIQLDLVGPVPKLQRHFAVMGEVCETAELLNAGPHIFKRIVVHVTVNSRPFRPFQPLLARIELMTALGGK